MRPKADPGRRRLTTNASAETEAARHPRTEGGLGRRIIGPGLGRIGRLLARLLPQNWIRGIDRMLMMANEPWSLPGFLGIWALSIALGVLLLFYVVASLPNATATQIFAITVAIFPFAVLLPYARLRNKVKKRQKAIVRALPDAMDLLTTSVEAGLGVDAAFALVTEKTEGPLSETFALYLRQVGLGRARQDALVYVADRTGVPDLIGIAHSVNQGDELGTPIGDVLRRQAEDLRVARRQRAQLAAARAPVLMTIPMALCFLPAMVAVVIVPSILNLVRFVGTLGD
jgi:tight adherence protein C